MKGINWRQIKRGDHELGISNRLLIPVVDGTTRSRIIPGSKRLKEVRQRHGHAEVKAVSTSTLRGFSMMRVAWISKSLRMMKE